MNTALPSFDVSRVSDQIRVGEDSTISSALAPPTTDRASFDDQLKSAKDERSDDDDDRKEKAKTRPRSDGDDAAAQARIMASYGAPVQLPAQPLVTLPSAGDSSVGTEPTTVGASANSDQMPGACARLATSSSQKPAVFAPPTNTLPAGLATAGEMFGTGGGLPAGSALGVGSALGLPAGSALGIGSRLGDSALGGSATALEAAAGQTSAASAPAATALPTAGARFGAGASIPAGSAPGAVFGGSAAVSTLGGSAPSANTAPTTSLESASSTAPARVTQATSNTAASAGPSGGSSVASATGATGLLDSTMFSSSAGLGAGSPLVARAALNSAAGSASSGEEVAPADAIVLTARATDLLASVSALPGATITATAPTTIGKANLAANTPIPVGASAKAPPTKPGAPAAPAAPAATAAKAPDATADPKPADVTAAAPKAAAAPAAAGTPAPTTGSGSALSETANGSTANNSGNSSNSSTPNGSSSNGSSGNSGGNNGSTPGAVTTSADAGKRIAGAAKKTVALGADATIGTGATDNAAPTAPLTAGVAPVKTLTDPTAKTEDVATAAPQTSAEDAVTAAEAVGHRRVLTSGEAHGQVVVPELGRFEVHASTGDAQQVAVRVHADDAQAHAALAAQTTELRAHVQADVRNATVTVDPRSFAENRGQNRGSERRSSRDAEVADTGAETVKPTAGQRARFVL